MRESWELLVESRALFKQACSDKDFLRHKAFIKRGKLTRLPDETVGECPTAVAESSFCLSSTAIVGGMDDESPTDLGCRFIATIGRKTIVVENEYQVFDFARRSAQIGGEYKAFGHFFWGVGCYFHRK